MKINNHSTGASKFLVGMMLSTALSTGYAYSQDTQPTDSIPTKPKTESALFKFKENVISVFKTGKEKVEKAFGNKSTTEATHGIETVTDTIIVGDALHNAVNATRLKKRQPKDLLSEVAARDIIKSKPNEIVHEQFAPYTYGKILADNNGDLIAAGKSLTVMANAKTEQADAVYYKSLTVLRTVNAEQQINFAAKTVRPDIKKGSESAIVKQLQTPTQCSDMYPEMEILGALNTAEHIGNMAKKSHTANDSIASIERLLASGSNKIGAGDMQKLVRRVEENKSSALLKDHFPNYKSIVKNVIKPYDHENKINAETATIGTLFNHLVAGYIMENAGPDRPFKTTVKIQTVEEKAEAVKPVIVAETVKPEGSVGEVKFEKGNFYYGYGREMTFANSGDPAGFMTKQDNPGSYAMSITKLGYSHNFSDLEKSFNETGLPPRTQFIAGAEIGLGNINYAGLQYGQFDFPAFSKTLPVIGLNASIIHKDHKATLAMTNLINLAGGSLDEQVMIKKGVSSFWTLGYENRLKEGVTNNGMQWHLDAGASFTFSGANRNNVDGNNPDAVDNAMQAGKYHTPFASTYAIKIGVGATMPERFKLFGGTDINLSLVRGGQLAGIENCGPMTGVQVTISPKALFSKRNRNLTRVMFDENVKTAMKNQARRAEKQTNFVVTPRR